MSGSYLLKADSSDVDELVAAMTNEMHYWFSLGDIYDNGKCFLIYKVLQCIREACPDAYEPSVLSIGSYHHGASSLLPMEKEKWLCLDYILKLNTNRRLHHYLAMLAELERDARICYSEDNQMDVPTFVQMLLLDSCFILVCLNGIGAIKVHDDVNRIYSQDHNAPKEVVLRQNEGSTSYEKGKERMDENVALHMEQDELDAHQQSNNMELHYDDSQEKLDEDEQWYSSSAVYDLLLSENQIPFFIVTEVFHLLADDEGTAQRSVLADNLSKFMEGILLHFPLAIDANRTNNFDHLLHLCYMYFKPSRKPQEIKLLFEEIKGYCYSILCRGYKYLGWNADSQKNEEDPLSNHASIEIPHSLQESIRWRSAVQYHDAGIEFLEREFHRDNSHSPLDIDFSNGVLYVPCLPIDDKTATLFRNLIAFEQSCPRLGNDFAAYVYFMSQLVSDSDDVALLARKGVLVHQLDSDEEVSALFSKLFEYVTFDFCSDHYLKSLAQTMEAHYQNRVHRWMAWLWHNHFGNPWLGFAAFASAFMVFCSIGQTILAYMSYMTMRQP